MNIGHKFLSAINEFSTLKIIDPLAAQRLSLLIQLNEIEFLETSKINEIQDQQLSELLSHVCKHSDKYRSLLTPFLPIDPSNARQALSALPILTRSELQTSKLVMGSMAPESHGEVLSFTTSGSTGQPVTVINTAAAMIIREAILLQTYLWHLKPDVGMIALITAHSGTPSNQHVNSIMNNWGSPFFPLLKSGLRAELNIKNPIRVQAEWLRKVNPAVLVTYPSNLAQLLVDSRENQWNLTHLTHIRLIGESVSEQLINDAESQWGVLTSNAYSSEELGTIAVQCPESNLMHIMSPGLIVEIIDKDGNPIKPGEIGKIVVTDLFNFAMPIIRYEIGDQGSLGEACQCGRNLPTISSVVGRYRNMLHLENGERFWPRFGLRSITKLYGIKQFQVIQKSYHELEVRFHITRSLSPEEKAQIKNTMTTSLGQIFRIDIIEIPKPLSEIKSGKFEEFISLVAQG